MITNDENPKTWTTKKIQDQINMLLEILRERAIKDEVKKS